MAYKGIRIVGMLSLVMAACCLAALIWTIFGPVDQNERAVIRLAGQGFALVFTLLALLASHASSVLERQADQIASMERELADLKSAGAQGRPVF
jgi:hypothetical protein